MTEEPEEEIQYEEEVPEEQPPEEEDAPPKEFENELDFNNELINPKAEIEFPWLTRDKVLGNINDNQLKFVQLAWEEVKLLKHMGLHDAAAFFEADAAGIFVATRSLNGFESKLLRTSISKYEGLDDEAKENQRRGFKKLFGRQK